MVSRRFWFKDIHILALNYVGFLPCHTHHRQLALFYLHFFISMPRWRLISDFEKWQILAYHRECLSIRDIADILERSPNYVWGFLMRQNHPLPRKAPRKSYKISEKSKRILFRHAKKGEKVASELRDALKLNIGVRRVQQILSSCLDLKYVKINRAPFMNQVHMEKCLQWARRFISRGDHFWTSVFSDEKKVQPRWSRWPGLLLARPAKRTGKISTKSRWW